MLLTIFYDGYCPLCVEEMKQLQTFDLANNLNFENIYATDFSERYPEINADKADRMLHGLCHDGQMLLGLDVTVKAWQLVGKKPWLVVLRWPVISWFADHTYLFFARNRYRFSYWFTGKERCDVCENKLR